MDDNFIGNNKKQIKSEVLPALIEWRKGKTGMPFSIEASINLADDLELVKLMALGRVRRGVCRYRGAQRTVGIDILQDLKRKAQRLQAMKSWNNIAYFLFARSGFTPALQQQADIEENIRLISVEEILT